MKFKALTIILAITLTLTGCVIFEPQTYGVPDSKWHIMSSEERVIVRARYEKSQRDLKKLTIADNQEPIREGSLVQNKSVQDHSYARPRNDAVLGRQEQLVAINYENNLLASMNGESLDRAHNQDFDNPVVRQRQPQEEQDIAQAKIISLDANRLEKEAMQHRSDAEKVDTFDAARLALEIDKQEKHTRNPARGAQTYVAAKQLNEDQLVRGGQVVMDLQRRLGRQPLLAEMQNELQSSMHISPRQARQIIESMGLY